MMTKKKVALMAGVAFAVATWMVLRSAGSPPSYALLANAELNETTFCVQRAKEMFESARWDNSWSVILSVLAIISFAGVLVSRLGTYEADRRRSDIKEADRASATAIAAAWRFAEILSMGAAVVFFSLTKFVNLSELARAEYDAAELCAKAAIDLRRATLESSPTTRGLASSASVKGHGPNDTQVMPLEICSRAILATNGLRSAAATIVAPFRTSSEPQYAPETLQERSSDTPSAAKDKK